MTQSSTTTNPCQPITIPSNTIQNQTNDGHYMTVTTRGGKQTIDPPMSPVIKEDMRKKDNVVKASVELGDAKWSSYLDLHHHFHRDW